MDSLARSGNIRAVQWAHKNGCPWGHSTCNVAVHYGQLEVLKWLHSHQGCPLDERAYAAAARRGHLEMLQWMQMIENDAIRH